MSTRKSQADTHDEDIRDLKAAIGQLRLAQSRLDAFIAGVQNNRDRRAQGEPSRDVVRPTRRRTVHPLSRFTEGDYVRIKNPKQGQPETGIVFGATRSALVRMQAANGEEI